MSLSAQNSRGTGKQVECSDLRCSQLVLLAITEASGGTSHAPAPRPTAPIPGRYRTATSLPVRTEKGATRHSQNHQVFTWSHEFCRQAGDWGPCTMCDVSFQGEGESCKEHGEPATCLANAKCTISFNRTKPLILWLFQPRWKYLEWFGCYFLLK